MPCATQQPTLALDGPAYQWPIARSGVPREEFCGRSLTKASGSLPADGGSTPPARSTAPPDPDPPAPDLDPGFEHEPEDYIPLEPAPAEAGEPGPDDDIVPDEIDRLIERAAKLTASTALSRFLGRRLELDAVHGERAATDLGKPAYQMARAGQERLIAAMDRLRGNPGREQLELARRAVESVGAIVFALHDRLTADLAALPASHPEHGDGLL